jgi:hypothetical protein
MRRKILFLLPIVLTFYIPSIAQIRVGAYTAYGSHSNLWGGGGVSAEFFIHKKIAISPNLTVFFPEKNPTFERWTWEINTNCNYYFLSRDIITLYGLLGANVFITELKSSNRNESYYDAMHEWGFNLGLGSTIKLGRFIPFYETKYSPLENRLALLLGVKLTLFN